MSFQNTTFYWIILCRQLDSNPDKTFCGGCTRKAVRTTSTYLWLDHVFHLPKTTCFSLTFVLHQSILSLHFSVYHFQINTGSYFLSPPSASSCRPWQPISEAQNATPTPLQKETSSKQYFYNIFVEKYFPIKGTLSVAQLVSGRFPLYQRSEVGNANPTVCHH